MKSQNGHINSYYAASTRILSPFEALNSKRTTKTCIIGGGLAGLTCARELAKAGHAVTVLEANRLGWAASGRNGGFVSEGFSEGMDNIVSSLGVEHAQRLFRLSRDGAEYVKKTVDELKRPDIIQGYGGLKLIRHGKGEALRQAAKTYADLFEADREFLTGAKLLEYVNSPTYKAGLLNRNAFHIHPLAYVNGLAADLEKREVEIFENSPVIKIYKQGAGWCAETAGGTVYADNLVLATSVYGGVFSPLERALVPVSTYVVTSKPLGDALDGVIDFKGTIADSRRAGDYYRIIGQGAERRLLWGGRITTRQSVPRRLENLLSKDISKIFPQLKDIEIEYAWAGKMGYTRHKMPLIGQLWPDSAPNLWSLTGFGGHGLNTTAMGGNLISDALTNRNDNWRQFIPFGPKWTGSTAGLCAVQLSYWGMQMRDWVEERAVRH